MTAPAARRWAVALTLLALLSSDAPALCQVITTIGGKFNIIGSYGNGVPALTALLHFPFGVSYYDATETLFIADTWNNQIRTIATFTGIISLFAGNGTAGSSGDGGLALDAMLNAPYSVAVHAASGVVYVADTINHCIRAVSVAGIITTVAGTSGASGYTGDFGLATAAQLNSPYGVGVSAWTGDVYVADSQNNAVRRVDTLTQVITTIAGTGVAGFSGDGGNGSRAAVHLPGGVAVDAQGTVYFSDTYNARIRAVTADGLISTFAGNGSGGWHGDGGPATLSQINMPQGVTYNASDNSVYLADVWECAIRRVDALGVITIVAGNHNQGYSGDHGVATQASLFNAYSTAVRASDGALFIADTFNHVIRMVLKAAPPPPSPPQPPSPPNAPPPRLPPSPAVPAPALPLSLPAPSGPPPPTVATSAPPPSSPPPADLGVAAVTTRTANPAGHSGAALGAIVGGAVGGAIIGLALLCLYIWWRRRDVDAGPGPLDSRTSSAVKSAAPLLTGAAYIANPAFQGDYTTNALWAADAHEGMAATPGHGLGSLDAYRERMSDSAFASSAGTAGLGGNSPASTWGTTGAGTRTGVSASASPGWSSSFVSSTAQTWGPADSVAVGVGALPWHLVSASRPLGPFPAASHPTQGSQVTGGLAPNSPPDAARELVSRLRRGAQHMEPLVDALLPVLGSTKMNLAGVQWTQGAMVDRGGAGKVYVGHDSNGALIAIKVQPLPTDTNPLGLELLLGEINALQKLQHRNVVQYLGSALDANNAYIFMAYEPKSLAMVQKDGLEEGVVRKYTRQILTGLDYVHSQGIAHRDIKAANMLVDRDGIIKLTDFGSAKMHQSTGVLSIAHAHNTTNIQSIAGTPHWMSPEICLSAMGQGAGYSGTKADVWSLGVTVVEMMMGAHPWCKKDGLQAIWQVVNDTAGLPRPPHASPLAHSFLDLCLQRDPAQRATVAQLLAHPFVAAQDELAYGVHRCAPSTPPVAPYSGGAVSAASSTSPSPTASWSRLAPSASSPRNPPVLGSISRRATSELSARLGGGATADGASPATAMRG